MPGGPTFPLTRGIDMNTVDNNSEKFGGYGPVHRRRLRPNRGSPDDDQSDTSDNESREATDALRNREMNDIMLPIPFVPTSCETCLQQGKENYILLNLNNAVQHARSHHCGVGVLYTCKTFGKTYKTKHAAQCHVPKCKSSLMRRTYTQFAEFVGMPLRPREVSRNMNEMSTQWNETRSEQ